nr:hypothetical protein [Tanacetum cinerariifolium]
VIGLGYTPMFLTHFNEALEIEKFKRSRENKIEFAYDYGNLNASYVNEKINFEDDYFQEIINPDFEKIDSPFQQISSLKPYVPNVILEKIIIDLEDEVVNLLEKEKVNLEIIESLKSKGVESSETVSSESENQSENDCLVVEKECDKKENSIVIAPGMFKLNVSQCVSPISMSKSSCDSNNVEIKLKRKRRKRKSSKQNVKQVDNDVSSANNDFVHFLDLDTFSSVRRPRHRDVIWKKKGSSNTSNVGLCAISLQVKMSQDMLTVGSTMGIPLLYRGEYSQWSERFMNYLEEQTDGEVMINCIKHGDQPLPRVNQVSTAGTSSTEQLPLKDKSMWSDQEKKIQKIDHLARSLLIKGLPNDIYSLIDRNKTTKDLWDALARHMLGSKYVINDLKKCEYSKDNCELNFKFLNNIQPEWKQYATMMRLFKNLMDINIVALYNNLKQNQGDVNDAMRLKKKIVLVTSDPLALIVEKMKSANKKQEFVKSDDKKVEKKDDEKKRDMIKVKCYNCKKEGHFAKDCKKAKVKDYEYYKTKMLLTKKDKDEQVLLAKDHAWMESSSDLNQEINANTVLYYLSESKSKPEYETSEYYDNTTTYGLFVNDNDDQEIFHDCENFPENLIESQIDHNESGVDHNDSKGIDKLIRKFSKKIVKCLKCIEKANQQNKDFKNQNKDLQDKYDVLKNQATTFDMKNNGLNEQMKVLIEKNDDLLLKRMC